MLVCSKVVVTQEVKRLTKINLNVKMAEAFKNHMTKYT